ncbi:Cytochrome c oxidase copper chaperone [Thalictrum thalictroides]|uniref:Cytochrome c oxidase copper chaperone n=1 Tax=Thalictrum thalictroides TaxID=46969 RepID=A0A7J6VD48_THATH|nr:Cytochrome c oxidase copper chaperone [Thalictrum thalictroides]
MNGPSLIILDLYCFPSVEVIGGLCEVTMSGSNSFNFSSDTKPKKKICCACPNTKRLRDECIVEHGEDACSKWIKAHLDCLRTEGFNVKY